MAIPMTPPVAAGTFCCGAAGSADAFRGGATREEIAREEVSREEVSRAAVRWADREVPAGSVAERREELAGVEDVASEESAADDGVTGAVYVLARTAEIRVFAVTASLICETAAGAVATCVVWLAATWLTDTVGACAPPAACADWANPAEATSPPPMAKTPETRTVELIEDDILLGAR